jgi:hypothetical protein
MCDISEAPVISLGTLIPVLVASHQQQQQQQHQQHQQQQHQQHYFILRM